MTEWITTSSVLIVVVVALRYLLRGKISLRLQYGLWALVLVRLLLPFSIFDSSISVMNAVEEIETLQLSADMYTYSPAIESIEFVPDADNIPTDTVTTGSIVGYYPGDYDKQFPTVIIPNATAHEYQVIEKAIEFKDILAPIWLTGLSVMLLVFLISNLRYGSVLRRERRVLDVPGSIIPVYISAKVETPCLFGFFRPAIYVTEECAADKSVLRHVLAHESTHYRHGDNIWAILRCAALALHWYNPLVWLAAFLSRRDAELACDEGAIKRLGEAERTSYGCTLIGLTCQDFAAKGLVLTATTMTASKKSLRERIMLIAKKPKMAVYTLIAVLLIAAVAVGCTFSGSKNDVEPDADETNKVTDSIPDRMVLDHVAFNTYISIDHELMAEIYEKYQSFEIGAEVENAAFKSVIRVGFAYHDAEDFTNFYVTQEGYYAEHDGLTSELRYYELAGGTEIYEYLMSHYYALEEYHRFEADSTEITFGGKTVTAPGNSWYMYGIYEWPTNVGLVSQPEDLDYLDLRFTDEDFPGDIRKVRVYSDGTFSPEPGEGQERYYYISSQSLYMYWLAMANFNAATAETADKDEYSPLIVLTGDTAVEYYSRADDITVFSGSPVFRTAPPVNREQAIYELSKIGSFDTIYILDTTGDENTLRNAENFFSILADNIVSSPAQIEAHFGWTLDHSSAYADTPYVTVTSGGNTVVPYEHMAFSKEWTGNGWLEADGLALTPEYIQSIADEIPTVTLYHDFCIAISTGLRSSLTVYDEDFQPVHSEDDHYYGFTAVNWLQPGEYYCVFGVYGAQGEYIEAGGEYEESAYQCIFRLIVGGVGYVSRGFSPADCNGFDFATYSVNGSYFTISDPETMDALEAALSRATETFLPACPFGSTISIHRSGGDYITICPAEDGCSVFFSDGKCWELSDADMDVLRGIAEHPVVTRNAFYFTGDNEALVELYAREIYAKELLSVPSGDDHAITDYKLIDCELFAVRVDGGAVVGTMEFAFSPEKPNQGYWWAGNTGMGDGEYEGMLTRSYQFELTSLGNGYWECTGMGTGGAGGWGYIHIARPEAALENVLHYLEYGDPYAESIIKTLPLIDWSEVSADNFFEIMDLVETACIGEGRIYGVEDWDTWEYRYPYDQHYRDLYCMKAALNMDPASGLAARMQYILNAQYKHDSEVFEQCLQMFSAKEQETLRSLADDIFF